jgi:anti-anti-sigma factor
VDLQTTTSVVGGMPVLSVSGTVDLATVPGLRDALVRLVGDHPGGRVVVDLDGVIALDDTGLGVLLGAAGRSREAGGDLVVVAAGERLRRRFATTGLDRAVEVAARIIEATSLYHLALPADWAAAQQAGEYTTSTRGRSLAEEGFIHCSFARQVAATAARFYADVDDVVVLRIDPSRLGDAAVVVEDLFDAGEAFPHIYGPIPVAAVVGVRRLN